MAIESKPIGAKTYKHGKACKGKVSPEFVAWQNMISRCYVKHRSGYENYGGRGIIVCERWRKCFENFYIDMGDRPSKYHSLDRFPDVNGNYDPGNVRWATKKQQANNTRRNVFIEHLGIRKTAAQWSQETGIREGTIRMRVQAGMSSSDILYKGHLQKRLTQ